MSGEDKERVVDRLRRFHRFGEKHKTRNTIQVVEYFMPGQVWLGCASKFGLRLRGFRKKECCCGEEESVASDEQECCFGPTAGPFSFGAGVFPQIAQISQIDLREQE